MTLKKGKININPKFKVGNHVRISKCKDIFAKGYVLNDYKEVFAIKKVKNTVPWAYIIEDFKCEEIAGTFYENIIAKNKSKRVQSWKINQGKRW